jgi:CRP-like cAMP-binding protein
MVSAEWLKRTELFDTLGESQLNAVLSSSTVKSYSQGETIFQQGEDAKKLYVLIHGEVDLTVKAQEEIGFMTSKIEREGAVFGTPSLMEPFRYNVTARCLRATEVLTIEADHIRKKIEEDPKLGVEIMRKLASLYFNRLNELRSGVSNLVRFFKLKKS